MSAAPPHGRQKTGRFAPGASGNPGGRASTKDFEALCRERSPAAVARLLDIGKGRGVAAVKALEIVIAYGFGKPQTNVTLQAKGPLGGSGAAFAGAARLALEAAVAAAEEPATDRQTVALVEADRSVRNDSAVIDVTAEPAAAERGQVVAESTDEGGSP